jgi:hypothetical protein
MQRKARSGVLRVSAGETTDRGGRHAAENLGPLRGWFCVEAAPRLRAVTLGRGLPLGE